MSARWLYGEEYVNHTDRELVHLFHHEARVTGRQRDVGSELIRRGYDAFRLTEDQILGAIMLRELREGES